MNIQRAYQQIKNIYHFLQSHFWRLYYNRPDKNMFIYGVTGTNGKTTTSIILGNILREQYGREKVGLLTTIVFWLGREEKINKTKMTTLTSRQVFSQLKQMQKRGVKYVVMETTSHALDQYRLAGIKLNGAIILNLYREHLDYHRTMADYAKAKMKIVNYLKIRAPLVINKQFPLSDFKFPSHVELVQFSAEEARHLETPLTGDWNKENTLAAKILADKVGVNEQSIRQGIGKTTNIPGRMEWINKENKNTPQVLVDYALTPDALERVYRFVARKTNGKIYAVLGACGNRDRGKRPDMAQTVAAYADEIILTREDPWTEDEEQIFQDLEKGLTGTPARWQRITDRKEAIEYCLREAAPHDVIVVTGKGAEVGMGIGEKIIPWNDKEIIQELLRGN